MLCSSFFLSFFLHRSSMVTGGIKCVTDADCPNTLCARGLTPKCYIFRCICV
uniref:Nodule-specific cysteine-rich peptide G11 n=1 Tax=Pisum sativum TaxID=3888 RepID=A0A7T8DV47_PEA|nr:nodule-specific cysteine-rich peptide G11 [Pisum sativum]